MTDLLHNLYRFLTKVICTMVHVQIISYKIMLRNLYIPHVSSCLSTLVLNLNLSLSQTLNVAHNSAMTVNILNTGI